MNVRLALITPLLAATALLLAGCVAPVVQPVQTATMAPVAEEALSPTASAISTAVPEVEVAPTAVPSAPPPALVLVPLDPEMCAQLAQDMAQVLDVAVTQEEAPITDPVSGETGTGCQATATGTGEQFASPDAVVSTLADMLEAQGWQEDPMLAAGGPTGIGAGFRQGNQVCMAGAIWHPDASANCPDDQPISTCEVTPAQQLYTVTLNCAQSTAGMANPTSMSCSEQSI